MPDTPEILRLRVLLCFLSEDETDCTVMEIARTLREEHYSISRAIAALEKDGLISKEQPRKPHLTEKGRQQAQRYAERINITTSHLLYEGVNMESAANDAYYWALYNTDETMDVIRSAEEKYRVKYELRDQKQFSGAILCRMLKDGEYQFPFIIYRENAKNGSNISMANEGFEHPCVLSIKDGKGLLRIKALDISANSAVSGKRMRGHVESLKYFDSGSYVNADRSGYVLSIPASAFTFKNIGEGIGQILHGQVCMKIRCSVGVVHMPESTAIFTMLI
ncbi:MAG: hypothetical protein K2O02_07000 [Lachnospiraceae bacterium]|nr:hypothetical protein [Lachnospiraceae bacterium]